MERVRQVGGIRSSRGSVCSWATIRLFCPSGCGRTPRTSATEGAAPSRRVRPRDEAAVPGEADVPANGLSAGGADPVRSLGAVVAVPVGWGQARRGYVVTTQSCWSRAFAGSLLLSKEAPDIRYGLARNLGRLGGPAREAGLIAASAANKPIRPRLLSAWVRRRLRAREAISAMALTAKVTVADSMGLVLCSAMTRKVPGQRAEDSEQRKGAEPGRGPGDEAPRRVDWHAQAEEPQPAAPPVADGLGHRAERDDRGGEQAEVDEVDVTVGWATRSANGPAIAPRPMPMPSIVAAPATLPARGLLTVSSASPAVAAPEMSPMLVPEAKRAISRPV